MMTAGGLLFGAEITAGVIAFLLAVHLAGLGVSRLRRARKTRNP